VNPLRFYQALLPLLTALFVGVVADGQAAASSSQGPRPSLRFHHIHYVVDDQASAMNEAASRLEGVRVILPGLGAGVRSGSEFILFDRARASEALPQGRSAHVAIPLAADRLKSWGLDVGASGPHDGRLTSVSGDRAVAHVAFATDDLAGLVRALAERGVTPLWRRDDSALFDAGEGLTIEIVRDTEREDVFWCPMHPDVRSADPGTCPVCAMELVPIPPPTIGEYRLDVTQVRDAGGATRGLEFVVREPATDAVVTNLAVVHERRFHLFVVGRDLQYFAHVHPELASDGRLRLDHPLPPGEYMLVADFLPIGGSSQMVQKAIIVTGTAAAAPRADDRSLLEVRMHTEHLGPGKHARLTFTVSDAKTGAPVTDLEPYLGAPAHMLIVRRDLSDAIHAHPEEQVASGPTVSFHPIIPAVGDYKLWIQFQRAGKVSTTAFEFTVR
jgi:hypothetical protein